MSLIDLLPAELVRYIGLSIVAFEDLVSLSTCSRRLRAILLHEIFATRWLAFTRFRNVEGSRTSEIEPLHRMVLSRNTALREYIRYASFKPLKALVGQLIEASAHFQHLPNLRGIDIELYLDSTARYHPIHRLPRSLLSVRDLSEIRLFWSSPGESRELAVLDILTLLANSSDTLERLTLLSPNLQAPHQGPAMRLPHLEVLSNALITMLRLSRLELHLLSAVPLFRRVPADRLPPARLFSELEELNFRSELVEAEGIFQRCPNLVRLRLEDPVTLEALQLFIEDLRGAPLLELDICPPDINAALMSDLVRCFPRLEKLSIVQMSAIPVETLSEDLLDQLSRLPLRSLNFFVELSDLFDEPLALRHERCREMISDLAEAVPTLQRVSWDGQHDKYELEVPECEIVRLADGTVEVWEGGREDGKIIHTFRKGSGGLEVLRHDDA